ncbi:RNA methyltransferase [Spirochaetia bacterium]|nr:RNA methyltransferase [Spirochaetia bacterium]
MIPLYKLEQLPRSQRLRKIARDFGEFESRLNRQDKLTNTEIQYVTEIPALLLGDTAFPPAAIRALLALRDAPNAPASAGDLSSNTTGDTTGDLSSDTAAGLRRSLNTVRHILLAETGRYPADWDFIGADGALDSARRQPFPGMRVYLEDIRSPFNVGAMFRTAESFGAEKLWLSPLCADPRHPRAERTAMGCVDALPWERLPGDPFTDHPGGLPQNSPLQGPVFALETDGVNLAEFPFPARGTMIVGSEELGVSPAALAAADASLGRLSITTYGAKGSLNVSVAFGIAMQKWAEVLERP